MKAGCKSMAADAAAWDSYYKKHAIPWKSDGLSTVTRDYLRKYAKGTELLEIGCGTGEEAAEFRELGLEYAGFDVSHEAIRLAREAHVELERDFFVGDFFSLKLAQKYSVLYDKGVFHNLKGPKHREKFVERAASLLKKDGIWITVCGSADFYDPKVPHGAIFLQHLIAPAEIYFEILEIVKAPYGAKNKSYDGWYCVFRRR